MQKLAFLSLVVLGVATATEPVVLSSVRLKWPAGPRLLMIHADDLGMCRAANAAGKQAFADGRIDRSFSGEPCRLSATS